VFSIFVGSMIFLYLIDKPFAPFFLYSRNSATLAVMHPPQGKGKHAKLSRGGMSGPVVLLSGFSARTNCTEPQDTIRPSVSGQPQTQLCPHSTALVGSVQAV